MNSTHKPKVIVGLSGGVDSSVSALLLLQQGYQVEGLFMKNWEEDDTSTYCSAEEDLADVRAICKKLNIPLHTVNFAQEYWQNVFSNFLEEYQAGFTPNPDILCNKEIKFKVFLEYAMKLGGDFIATGHYVQKDFDGTSYRLLKGLDPKKDQSYFLYTLGQYALSKSLFPVGHLEKAQVRQIAQEADLITHSKKDSTGICFIGERKFKTFLQDFILNKPGIMQTPEGEKIGQHDGLMFYTLGQRQGLKIGGRKGALEKPWYVVAKDLKENILYVTQQDDHPWQYCTQLKANQLHWIAEAAPTQTLSCNAKVRYRQTDQACQLTVLPSGEVHVKFADPQRAVTPGQSLVLYQDNICLGGGIIQGTDSPGGIRQTQLQINKEEIGCLLFPD